MACDTVILFDLPTEVCLEGAVTRLGKGRYDMPWIDTELDSAFKAEIAEFGIKNLPTVYALLEKHKEGKMIVILKSRSDADQLLKYIE